MHFYAFVVVGTTVIEHENRSYCTTVLQQFTILFSG